MKNSVGIKIKKILVVFLILFLFPAFSNTCTASFNVNPRELSITMTNDFLNGNTSKKITITNTDNQKSINISWYLSHPEPISYIRPNKTTIPNLSWIDLEPKWQIIPPNSNAVFYIHFNIPEILENLNKSWESWITFKAETTGFINIEHAVRLYIDTPTNLSIIEKNNQDKGNDQPGFELIVFIAAVAIALLIFRKKKK